MSRKSKSMLAIGPLSPKSAGQRHFIPNAHSFEAPTRVCNASMAAMTPQELRALQREPTRPGCLDAFALRSVGTKC